jgi:hypothetical protein
MTRIHVINVRSRGSRWTSEVPGTAVVVEIFNYGKPVSKQELESASLAIEEHRGGTCPVLTPYLLMCYTQTERTSRTRYKSAEKSMCSYTVFTNSISQESS